MKTQTLATFLLLGFFLTGAIASKMQAASINDPKLSRSKVIVELSAKTENPKERLTPYRFWINYRYQRGIKDGVPYENHCDMVWGGGLEKKIDISKTKYGRGSSWTDDSCYSYIEIQKQEQGDPDNPGIKFVCPLITIDFDIGNISYDEKNWNVQVTPSHTELNDYLITPVDPHI